MKLIVHVDIIVKDRDIAHIIMIIQKMIGMNIKKY
jgi:hypothetical protein